MTKNKNCICNMKNNNVRISVKKYLLKNAKGQIGSRALCVNNENSDYDLLFTLDQVNDIKNLLKSRNIKYEVCDKNNSYFLLGNELRITCNINNTKYDLIFYKNKEDIKIINKIIKLMLKMPDAIKRRYFEKNVRINIFQTLMITAFQTEDLLQHYEDNYKNKYEISKKKYNYEISKKGNVMNKKVNMNLLNYKFNLIKNSILEIDFGDEFVNNVVKKYVENLTLLDILEKRLDIHMIDNILFEYFSTLERCEEISYSHIETKVYACLTSLKNSIENNLEKF